MYQVLARSWRPQSFDELVGQAHVARSLTNAIRLERLAHAYLFAGQRGTGKTSAARVLAKCLNCEQGPTPTPCNRCVPCQEITGSRALDVLEIDAASRTKVEQTRELLEIVSYAPARDRYKILIIDEAHMLSKASFNALLKTLEEPPANVLFILATTEIQKVPATILSRCQIFEFRRVGARELAQHLRRVADAEKIRISDSALERIARAGEGSVRDALSVLERVLAFCGHEVDEGEVLRLLGSVHVEVLAEFARALGARDAAGMLAVLDAVVDEGRDLVQFWNELIALLRDLLLVEAMPARADLLSRAPEEVAALSEASTGLSREDLTRAFQILGDLEQPLKSSSQPRFLFEAALFRLASLGAVRPIEDVLRLLASGAEVAPRSAPQPAPAPAPKKKADEACDRPRLAAAIHQARPMLGAIIEQASELSLDGERMLVRFPRGMEALKRQLERRENLTLLQQEAERVAGRPLRIRVELEGADPGAGATAAAADAVRPIATQQGAAPDARPTAESPSAGLLEEARRDPGTRELLEAFGARVLEIQPHAELAPSLDKPSRRMEES